MRVRMKTRIAGPGINAEPGAEIEVDDQFGDLLLKAGSAERIGGPPARDPATPPGVESAALEAEEAAVEPRPRSKRRGRKRD